MNLSFIEKIDRNIKKYKHKTPKLLKLLRMGIFHSLNPFLKRLYYNFYKEKLKNLSPDTQLFFVGRNDFGTQLYLLHYVKLWEEKRGPTCVVILTNDFPRIQKLASLLTPKTQLIYPDRFSLLFPQMLFGSFLIYCLTMNKIYPQLACDRTDGLHIFPLVGEGFADHSPFLDKDLIQNASHHCPSFVNVYKTARKKLDYRWNIFKDYFELCAKDESPQMKFQKELKELAKQLGVSKKYVLLNINCKDYQCALSNRRRIQFPERYNSLIDELIAKDYEVIIQGRQEQPHFTPRPGLIDYSKSPFTSIENDLFLFSNCEFVISSKSGIEIFASICNVPILGLNYTELLGMQPAKKMRFYPKYIRQKSTGQIISWKEHLNSPCFFEIGDNQYCPEYEYVDLSEEDMMYALREFLSIRDWAHTPLQKEFRQCLTPLHLELFQAQAVPCNVYLEKTS